MARNLDTNIDTPAQTPNPEAKWITWGIWSGVSLVGALLAVIFAGLDPGLLLAWVLGVIIAAMLMVFRRS
jgi:hypothetical protein